MNFLKNELLEDILNVVQRVYCLKVNIKKPSYFYTETKEWFFPTMEEAREAKENLINRFRDKIDDRCNFEIDVEILELDMNRNLNNKEIDDIIFECNREADKYTWTIAHAATNNVMIGGNNTITGYNSTFVAGNIANNIANNLANNN